MAKLLVVLLLGGALANGFAHSQADPPLLIDSHPSAVHLDAAD